MAGRRKPTVKKVVTLKQIGAKIEIRRPGAFSAKAKAAGMTTAKFAAKVKTSPSRFSKLTQKQATLARTFAGFKKKGASKK